MTELPKNGTKVVYAHGRYTGETGTVVGRNTEDGEVQLKLDHNGKLVWALPAQLEVRS